MAHIHDLYGGGRAGPLDPDAAFTEMEAAADEWTDAEAAAALLEETKHVLLAQLMSGQDGSISSREMHAKATSSYDLHVRGMVEARRKANRAKARLQNMKARQEARRTAEVSARVAIS
ncbi:MAG: hypothetical protein AAF205_00150 [Pseudomonadota bacterium]